MSPGARGALFGGAVVVVAVIVIVLISTLSGTAGGSKNDPFIAPFPAQASILSALKNVSPATAAKAGNAPGVVSPVSKPGTTATMITAAGPTLTSGGKPEIIYVGAEYCPYCAASRWPLTIALMRFGTFTGLQQTASSPIDGYPDTHTLTFAKAKYSSSYITFQPTEELSNECVANAVVLNTSGSGPKYVCSNGDYMPLQSTSKATLALVTKLDSTKYFGQSEANGPGIPFLDFGGKFVESGALYSPQLLAGAKWDQIVQAFGVPTAGIGQAILASANRYTAVICKMTGGKPGSVCNAPYVKTAEKALTPA